MSISIDYNSSAVCYNARCCSCGFDFVEGDPIIVGASSKVRGISTLPFTTGVVGRTYRFPCSSTSHIDVCQMPPASAHHLDCLRLQNERDHVGVNRETFTDSFVPPFEEKERRSRWLQEQYLFSLLVLFKGIFPNEITNQIAAYASEDLRSWALEMHAMRPMSTPTTYAVPLDRGPLWVSTTLFEGRRYLRSVAHGPVQNTEKYERITPTNTGSNTIYIAEDHQGVIAIVYGDSTNPPVCEKVFGIWWRAKAIEAGASLEIKTDHTKIRSIQFDNRDAKGALTLWAVPPPHELRIVRLDRHNFIRGPDLKRDAELRVHVLECNRPETLGYLVRSSGCGYKLLSIHAHILGEPLPHANAGHEPEGWRYIPMDQGEYITDIWAAPQRKVDLLIRTNIGRFFQTDRCSPGRTAVCRERIATFKSQPSRIFLETAMSGVLSLGFESSASLQAATMTYNINPPLDGVADWRASPGTFITWALTKDVKQVVPCRLEAEYKRVTGLVLYYKNGHREAVGQVHPDGLCPDETLDVVTGQSWFLMVADSHHFRDEIVLKIDTVHRNWGKGRVIEVGSDGILHWWWTPNNEGQAKIRYGNSAEAETHFEEKRRAIEEASQQDPVGVNEG